MCILHVWSATSEKLANEVFKAWQEIITEKRRLDKSRTMCWSGPDYVCTARINTARKRQFDSSKDMGLHSIRGLLHWICICGADERYYCRFDASRKERVWAPLRCSMSQSRALPCRWWNICWTCMDKWMQELQTRLDILRCWTHH